MSFLSLSLVLLAAQVPTPGQVGATVNGSLDMRVDRPELSAPSAASAARSGGDPVQLHADAAVRVRKGQRCSWQGRSYSPVRRDDGWYCERPALIDGADAVAKP